MNSKYPELSARIQSTFIDTLFIVMLMFIFSSILDRIQDPPEWLHIAMFVGIWVIYEPVCTAFGCTIGNYLKGIRVRQATDDSKRINIFQALIRYAVKVLLGWLSFLTVHQNTERRAIHDLAVGSVMVNVSQAEKR
jgi:uncharacterized RDD family membrane protein YckC